MTTHHRIQSEHIECQETGGVAARRCLALAGDYPADATVAIYGVTRTAAASGEMVTVDVLGRLEVEASAAITVGAAVQSGDDGRVAPRTGTNHIVGYAVTAASAEGDIIEIVRGI